MKYDEEVFSARIYNWKVTENGNTAFQTGNQWSKDRLKGHGMNFPNMLLRQKAVSMVAHQWPTLMRQKRSEPWKTSQNIRDTGHLKIKSIPSMLMRNLTPKPKTQAYPRQAWTENYH